VSHAINLKPRRQWGFFFVGRTAQFESDEDVPDGMWNRLNTHHAVQLLRSEACRSRNFVACTALPLFWRRSGTLSE
jgi:hypothetical protein